MTQTIISLGGWCRPAWQIRRATAQTQGYPFDWHITSYRALMAVLDPDFDPATALKPADCYINQFGSLTDGANGWIDQHYLAADKFDQDDGQVVMSKRTLAAIDKARERSAYLVGKLRADCQDRPVTFIRWIRQGLVDGEWHDAFKGEDAWAVKAALDKICAYTPTLIYVRSAHLEGPTADEFIEVEKSPWGDALTIGEPTRRFFADDVWTGDNQAWDQVFAHIAKLNPAQEIDDPPES